MIVVVAAAMVLLAGCQASTARTPPPLPSAVVTPAPTPIPTERATPSPTPAPTLSFDPNMPLPVTWGQIQVPALPAPWTVGDGGSKDSELLAVHRRGVVVGYVRVTVHLPEAYPGRDFRAGGFEAIRSLAADDLQVFIADRSGGLRAEPEPMREVAVAGGQGIWAAFRDVESTSGVITARYVFVYHWDGRVLWLFQTGWPPDPEFGRSWFDSLADQTAFDPQLEALVAGLYLPVELPSPVPF